MNSNKTLKRCFSGILNISGINYIARRINRKKTNVLLYHSVAKDDSYSLESDIADISMPRSVFERQMIYLKENFNVISLDDHFLEGCGAKADRPNVIINFDDGYLDNFTEAYPVLKRHDIKASFFISSFFIDNNSMLWFNQLENLIYNSRKEEIMPFIASSKPICIKDKKDKIKAIKSIKQRIRSLKYPLFLKAIEELSAQMADEGSLSERYYFRPMKWEYIKEIAKDSNITIGSHAKTHYPLSILPEKVLREELEGSKSLIEIKIGRKIEYLSYPHGSYNEEVIRIAKDCKYRAGLTTIHGFNDSQTDPYLMKRNEVGHAGDVQVFMSIASGSWDFIRKKVKGKNKEWGQGY